MPDNFTVAVPDQSAVGVPNRPAVAHRITDPSVHITDPSVHAAAAPPRPAPQPVEGNCRRGRN
jgi:hypothetical protein